MNGEIKDRLIELLYENNVRCDQTIEHLADDVVSIFEEITNKQQEEIEEYKKQTKRYEDLKKAENILDLLEQDAFKRSIYNTIDTIKQLENEIE
jgi:hypothetical protein